MTNEQWWALKAKIEAIDPHLRMETGDCLINGERAARVSAVYETSGTLAAFHHIVRANGSTAAAYFSRNCVEVARDAIKHDRAGRAILEAAKIIETSAN